MNIDKILLVGSGPYIEDWYRDNKHLITKDVLVVAMNNAWALDPERVDLWCFANDYFITAQCPPKHEDWHKLRCFRAGVTSHWIKSPFWYDQAGGSGTMFLNTAYHLINLMCKSVLPRVPIYCIGCDMVYTGDKTHFYGKGDPDPLRMGEDWLNHALYTLSMATSFELYNANLDKESRLPFQRKSLS